MKTQLITMKKALLVLGSTSMLWSQSLAQTARLQVIHNAADPAAASVDVYLNDALLLNNFAFRTATPYIDAPAGVPIKISIAVPTSTSSAGALANFTPTLTAGKTYLAVASGLVGTGFAANPSQKSTAFTLLLKESKETAAAGKTDLLVVHGATDAPTVDVVALGVGTLVNNASYSDITNYISVPSASYTLNVKDSTGKAIVASYKANLTSLGGKSAVVLASGFLAPAANKSGAAFGLIAVLPDGTVLPLGPADMARLQVIHNAADPAAASVDVYLNDALLLNNFAFRTATAFIDAPAGIPIKISVALPTSTSSAGALANFTPTLTPGQTYVAIANGLVGTGFAPNPNAKSTGFTLFVKDNVMEMASGANNVDLLVVHGATDAPAVDVVAEGVATIVNNAMYSDITNYITVPKASYTLAVKDSTSAVTVARFTADLSGLGGKSAIILASGFLTPASNKNGPAFGLIAVLANGTVVPLSTISGLYGSNLSAFAGLSAFPMPAQNNLTLEIHTVSSSKATVEILDLTGKSMSISEVSLQNGINQIPLSVENFQSGEYLIKVVSNSNASVLKCSVIK